MTERGRRVLEHTDWLKIETSEEPVAGSRYRVAEWIISAEGEPPAHGAHFRHNSTGTAFLIYSGEQAWRPLTPPSARLDHIRQDSIPKLFHQYRNNWKREVRFSSSLTDIVLNLNYQRIIGLGIGVLPYIFSDLSKKIDHWFWALSAIVGEDVGVGCETMDDAAAAWLRWARANGYLDAD